VSLVAPDRTVPGQNQPRRTWTFDTVHGPDADQESIYSEVAVPVLESVLQGYNGTILAYGQTVSVLREPPQPAGLLRSRRPPQCRCLL